MVGKESIHFFQLIKDFLTVYIPWQKASSPNTVRAYRDALNLLLGYLKGIGNLKLSEISFDIITRQTVESYLDWLEVTRNNSVVTRNHRLSCIRTFYRYAAGRDMLVTACSFELEKIPIKKIIKGHTVKYFEEDALKTILCQPNTVTKKGIRDLFYMILMYDTAARNQEILDLKVSDIYTSAKESHVVITGKGNKTRIVPLMRKTVEHFNNYLNVFHDGQISNSLLFYVVQKGHRQPISPDAVGKFMKIYGKTAREQNNNVPENLHPHMLRHSRAMHLYRGGMPLPLLSEWLGHAQLETTMIYAYADTKMKREAIEKATSIINPLKQGQEITPWQDDDELIKRLYGLV
ncbi:tyrosine-type recombinase/integrase [Clostridium estertheticum]|uniref:tyrosine-type recombinase/integrase n=1 Tax=Clostridium estertheticum TaxID=238834 RepID=UPI001C6EEE01|nr:tyrosine-type recombinase/integrase [Clostridium estertheticum]MBW9154796.1 site-specific integrase [Clostridium estertheticum]WLC83563.1 site-specific integrase [Clostridium estertheticum]WLC83714.1 site-specific integrase [Clostridium estertheticum]